MKSGFSCTIACLLLLLVLPVTASAAIPQQISYQGRLTDANGDPLAGPANLVFSICADSLCSNQLWSETHNAVGLNEGLFSVLLGSLTPIPASVFDGSTRYLSATLDGQPVTKRIAIGSVGYAYKSMVSDTAVVLRGGGTTDCADCNATFVNVAGPDSVYVTLGTAFLGKASGNRTSDLYGLMGYANNGSSGDAFAGRFEVGASGTGIHYALSTLAHGNSTSGAYGLEATAYGSSTGSVFAAALTAGGSGSGPHYGAYINSDGNGTGSMFGVWSEATNSSSGNAYGGYFRAASGGTGDHIGISGNGVCASDATAYGSYGYASNSSTGDVYGGYFSATTGGTGVHYGAKTTAYSASSSPVHGFQSIGENTGSGSTYGGSFFAHDNGTGHHYGIYTEASGTSANESIALYGTASTQGSATAFGGYFAANGLAGSGSAEAVSGAATNDGSGNAIGVHGWAQNNGANADVLAIGGLFGATGAATGARAALWAEVEVDDGNSAAGTFYGPVFVDGRLNVQGDFMVWGDKGAVFKSDDNRYRAVYCQESPENWFEDFGGARLIGGRARIELDPLFLQSVTVDEKHEMRVFIQLEGSCNGVYVVKGTTDFEVVELSNGTSDAAFSYRVVAKRRGHEDDRLELLKGPTPEEREKLRKSVNSQLEASRARMQAEQQRAKVEQQATTQRVTEPEVE